METNEKRYQCFGVNIESESKEKNESIGGFDTAEEAMKFVKNELIADAFTAKTKHKKFQWVLIRDIETGTNVEMDYSI